MNMSEIKAIKYWVMIESYSYNTIKALTAKHNLENIDSEHLGFPHTTPNMHIAVVV